MGQDAFLGLFRIFLSTGNFDTTFLVGDLLLLSSFLFFFIHFIENINPNTQLITELVDASTLGTNDTTNVLFIDLKFSRLQSKYFSVFHLPMNHTHIAINNFIILGIFDDLQYFFDYPVDLGADTTDNNNVLAHLICCFCTNFDGECCVLSNEAAQMVNNCGSDRKEVYLRVKSCSTVA